MKAGVLFPASDFTKADLARYYLAVSSYLLPHLARRPVTLKRYPNGVRGEFFWEKDAPEYRPRWVDTIPVPRAHGGAPIQYVEVSDRRALGWCANLAAIELHPFLHRAPALDTPTVIVFDLDPGEGADILDCADVALLLREKLERLNLRPFVKASGSKGLHVYVPLNTPVTYGATEAFAQTLAELLEQEHPRRIVSDMAVSKRRGKVFIDWSQNAPHKTTVAVYSLRATRARPFVSLPIAWEELAAARAGHAAESLSFDPEAALIRLKKHGDLFAGVLRLTQTLPDAFAAIGAPSRPTPPARTKTLATYRGKRNFAKTPEPAGVAPKRSRQGGRRRFVVQKHAASHLHYDFRLEMHGVLKSWAVPKGMPRASGEVRTAMETEDHPLDYLDFEGVIPRGEYGGGTIMVWDIGTYELIDGHYYAGRLQLFLSGTKLKGAWHLVRTDKPRRWLLTKAGRAARAGPATIADRSALTGRSLEEIAAARDRTWHSNRHSAPPDRSSSPGRLTGLVLT